MAGRICSAIDCNHYQNKKCYDIDGNAIRFHKFPSTTERRIQWAIALKRQDILDKYSTQKKSKTLPVTDTRVVCSVHFADAAYSCPARRHIHSRLLDTSVPSIFSYSSTTLSRKRKAPAKRLYLSPKKANVISELPSVAVIAAVSRNSTSSAQRTRLWRAKNTLKKMREIKNKLAQSRSVDAVKQDIVASLPSNQRPFIGLQLRMIGKQKVHEYSKEEQEFALALFHRGPAAYKMMRSIFWLPSTSVLSRLMRSCMANPGPCHVLLQALAGELEKNDLPGRIGTLGFDAMSLSPAVRYEKHHDRIGGFEQIGPDVAGRTPRIANQGLVAVVRTVRDRCKMPIGFELIENNPTQVGFGKIVNSYLEAAHNSGMRIVSITCDQERTQWAWLKRSGVCPDSSFELWCSSSSVVVAFLSSKLWCSSSSIAQYSCER